MESDQSIKKNIKDKNVIQTEREVATKSTFM